MRLPARDAITQITCELIIAGAVLLPRLHPAAAITLMGGWAAMRARMLLRSA